MISFSDTTIFSMSSFRILTLKLLITQKLTPYHDYCFETIGYIPNDNNEVKYTIDWEWLYGELPVGNYRLLKNIDSQYISIEFNVASTDE